MFVLLCMFLFLCPPYVAPALVFFGDANCCWMPFTERCVTTARLGVLVSLDCGADSCWIEEGRPTMMSLSRQDAYGEDRNCCCWNCTGNSIATQRYLWCCAFSSAALTLLFVVSCRCVGVVGVSCAALLAVAKGFRLRSHPHDLIKIMLAKGLQPLSWYADAAAVGWNGF